MSLFTIGHSITLLAGRAWRRSRKSLSHRRDHRLLGRLQGVRQHGRVPTLLWRQPNAKAPFFVFGLFHGFGLATKLQEFARAEGLVANIVSFNVGRRNRAGAGAERDPDRVHVLADARRVSPHALAFNGIVMSCGLLLVGYQMSGYFLPRDDIGSATTREGARHTPHRGCDRRRAARRRALCS